MKLPVSFSSRPSRAQKRRRATIGGLIFLLLAAITLIAVSNLNTIREFLSQAGGKNANIIIDTQAVLGYMPRPWRHLAQGGEDHAWRLQPLLAPVKALNPEYIRVDHIYDFYDIVQGSPGNLNFDFSKLDLLLDDIAATGAKPYIALSYMPPAISSGDILAQPQRWEDWQLTVQKTIEHISGSRKTADVYYEVWNEPDLFGNWKYYGEKNYLNLYTYAVRGANRASGVLPFKIGGPGITALYKNWFDALAKHAVTNNLRYDFFSWHRYTNNINLYPKDMTEVSTWIQDYPQLEPTLEFHITEWGHNSENDRGYDTTYSAAQTVSGAIQMIGIVQKAFVFEIQDGKSPENEALWGRWGMFTHADFGANPKPRYHALKMLDQISDQRLQVLGQGTWVKALAAKNIDNNKIELVLVNFDSFGRHGEQVPVQFQKIDAGSYQLTAKYLNGQVHQEKLATSAAVLQTWVNMPANSVAFVELERE